MCVDGIVGVLGVGRACDWVQVTFFQKVAKAALRFCHRLDLYTLTVT